MTDTLLAVQDLLHERKRKAAIIYSESFGKESVQSLRAPPPGSAVCDHEMFSALIRGLGQIVTENLKRSIRPKKEDPWKL